PPEPAPPEAVPADEGPPAPEAGEELVAYQQPGRQNDGPREARSPDKKWTAFVKDSDVWLRAEGGGETRLTQNGTPVSPFGMLSWSPDSKSLASFRIEPGDAKEVYLVESSPRGGGRAKLQTRPYALPGDKFATYELWLFDPETKKSVKAEVDRVEM